MPNTYDAPGNNDFRLPVRITVEPRVALPINNDPTAILYVDEFVQRPQFFEPMALDAQHPEKADAFLVDESNPKLEDSGLFRWLRTYATIPADRDEFEQSSFSFPAYKTDSSTPSTTRGSFTQSVVGKVSFSYKLTTDPINDFSILEKFHPLDVDSNKAPFVASDTTPTLATYQTDVAAGNFIRSRETAISIWRGNIYEAKNFQVVAL